MLQGSSFLVDLAQARSISNELRAGLMIMVVVRLLCLLPKVSLVEAIKLI
jgi:hypothetical protein